MLEAGSILALLVALAATAWAYPRLPETIPIHFGASGLPDGWGARRWILVLPGVALAAFALLSVIAGVLRRRPGHPLLNYPFRITAANAERQYRLVWRLLLAMRFSIVLDFVVGALGTIAVALGRAERLTPWTLILAISFAPVLLAWYFVAAWRAR